jgi:AcrR family transcriptional regulator
LDYDPVVIDTTRRARRKRETRERILDAAIACFVERGFDATTMDAIAERADVARATVFNHFADKQALLADYLGRRRARVRALLQAAGESNSNAGQTLIDAFAILAEENELSRPETRELLQAWLRTGGNAVAGPSEHLLSRIVANGRERRELRRDLDTQLVARLLFDAYVGIVIRWVAVDPPPFELGPTLREMVTTVLDGLRG